MAKTATYTVETNVGCGLVGALFHKAGAFKLRKAASMPPLSSFRSRNKTTNEKLNGGGAKGSRKIADKKLSARGANDSYQMADKKLSGSGAKDSNQIADKKFDGRRANFSSEIGEKTLNSSSANVSREKEETTSLLSSKTATPAMKLNEKRIISVSPRLSNSTDHIKGIRSSDSSRNSSSSSEKERNNASKAKKLANSNDHQHGKRNSDASRNSSSSSSDKERNKASQLVVLDYTRKLKKEPTFTSRELSMTIAPHRTSAATEMLNRGSSGNIMLLGHLGNLKKQGDKKQSTNNRTMIVQKKETNNDSTTPSLTMGNIVKNNSPRNQQFSNLYSSMMHNLNPDMLKIMGNEKYKQGRLEEALAFYNQAIAMDSSNATYYSNKSAALMGMGHLVEAVFECKEAIGIEPNYLNAHYRLAKLYLRLGEPEKALSHFEMSGRKADNTDIAQAEDLKTQLSKCMDLRNVKDWNTLLKECVKALSSGADSAPQIYAMKAEALMKVWRHEEAYTTILTAPTPDSELCTQLLGSAKTSYFLIIKSQVYLGAGRFEDAVATAQRAAKLNPSDEIIRIETRILEVTAARSNGNMLFEASKFAEASINYTGGLDLDPHNAILLCNRSACRSKLGQYEKAVEDCTMALNVFPSYKKARMRRADCNAKMERWEAAILDYEILVQEFPDDMEVRAALTDARFQQHNRQTVGRIELKPNLKLISVSSYEHLKQFLNAPGISVVLFCNKACYQQVLPFMEQVSRTFQSVKFFKVDVEENTDTAKSEAVTLIPAFKVFKKGSVLKDITGKDCDTLENTVKLYSG